MGKRLVDYVKLLAITFDKHFNFDQHISNVCSSSYFHICALRHIQAFVESETPNTIGCAIVGSSLELSLCQFHSYQHFFSQYQVFLRVQNSLARVITRSTANTISALNSLHWLQNSAITQIKIFHCSRHYVGPQ